MKRIKKIVLFLLLVVLFIPCTAMAEEKKEYDCSDVMDAVNALDEYNAQYQALDCDNATTDEEVTRCNLVIINRSATLEKIFEYNAAGTCNTIDLSSIIHDFENDCSNRFSTQLKVVTDSVMKFFYILAPFIVLIFSSLDLFKVITVGSPEAIKKNRSNFIKRIIAFLLLYTTPFVVNRIFALTIYDINGPDYICAEEITLSSKNNTPDVKGIYGGNNYGSEAGQAIADAAAEIKEYVIENKYTYSYATNWYVDADVIATPKQRSKTMCCATLIRAALYRAGVYTVEETNEIGINSETAGAVVQGLHDAGWEVIWDPDDLQPGDVLAYHTPKSTHYSTYIEGTLYHVGHVDIFTGDGQKVSTGNPSGFASDPIYSTFSADPSSSGQRFLCGLRYKGKK